MSRKELDLGKTRERAEGKASSWLVSRKDSTRELGSKSGGRTEGKAKGRVDLRKGEEDSGGLQDLKSQEEGAILRSQNGEPGEQR